MELSVIIPAHNEEETITSVLDEAARELPAAGIAAYELIVVDDGSTDKTASRAGEWSRRNPQARVLRHASRKGLGESLRTGYGAATLSHATWLPGDGQFSPADSARLLHSLEGGDIILGDVAPSVRARADSPWKLFVSRGLRVVTRALVRDLVTYTGLMVFRRGILEGMLLSSRTGILNFELIQRARTRGATVRRADFTVSVRPRQAGRSKVSNLRTALDHLIEVARLRWSAG